MLTANLRVQAQILASHFHRIQESWLPTGVMAGSSSDDLHLRKVEAPFFIFFYYFFPIELLKVFNNSLERSTS